MDSSDPPTDSADIDSDSDDGGAPSYDGLKSIILNLEPGDAVEIDVFVGTATVVGTEHEQVPYEKSIKTVEAAVEIQGPRGDHYDLTAGTFSKSERSVEVRPHGDSGRKKVSSIERVDAQSTSGDARWPPVIERVKGSSPPAHALEQADSWSITTVCYRFKLDRDGKPLTCAATGATIPSGDEHIFVKASRDRYPTSIAQTKEFKRWVFADTDALEMWFKSA